MEISHVIRGCEWLPSAPMHVFLYECFGWQHPQFAHLPLILKPEGNGKLSKRDGDVGGFPVFPLPWSDPKDPSKSTVGFKGDGYLPEALINILAFLGWNPGTNKEFYTLDELIQDFSLEKVNKAGARFNPPKAKWFNGQHIKNTPTEKLFDSFKDDLTKRGITLDDKVIFKILDSNKGKVNFIKDLYNEISFMFVKPIDFDQKALKKFNSNSVVFLNNLVVDFKGLNSWVSTDIQKTFENFVNGSGINFCDIAPQLRLVLTGRSNGSSLFDIMEIIGKDETINRIVNNSLPVVDNIEVVA
jgi:glutamyl-tRNA synthetase